MTLTCQAVAKQLPAFQDGELAPAGELQIRDHLRDCRQCRLTLAALDVVKRGLVADASWQPPAGRAAAAALQAAGAALRAAAPASRIIRFAPAVAAAAAVLALATLVAVRVARRLHQAEPVAFVSAPRLVVERPAAVVLTLAGAPETPPATALPPEQLKPFQLGAVPGPVGRAYVVCNGSVQPYDGAAAVTYDRVASGPPALLVDAFPRVHAAAPKRNRNAGRL